MEFRTRVEIIPYGWKIDHSMNGLSLGSCFAANVAARLKRAKFAITDNPFGLLFNPLSVADTLDRLDSERLFTPDDLAEDNGLWCNFAFHGSFSSCSTDDALTAMNCAVDGGAQALRDADYIIITFGTSWVYELAHSPGTVVANCHKFPASYFRRRRLTIREITDRYDGLLRNVLRDKHVIFTVSPVRHIKDGLVENTLSKATLLSAVHELVEAHENADYFPAFEIVNDELRDYRFYADDMVHPSAVAVAYIWERFGDAALSEPTREAVSEVEKIVAAMDHRPLNPGSPAHKHFRARMLERTRKLSDRYPEIDFSAEFAYFSTTG